MTLDQKGNYDAPLYDADIRGQIVVLLYIILACVSFAGGLLIGGLL